MRTLARIAAGSLVTLTLVVLYLVRPEPAAAEGPPHATTYELDILTGVQSTEVVDVEIRLFEGR